MKNNVLEYLLRKKTAILVIDVQNDYCSDSGKIAKERKFDLSPVQKIVYPLINFVDFSRRKNIPIIFIRIVEDHNFMAENAKIIFQHSGNPLDLCTPNSKGFEYYKIKPLKNDLEIIKYSYDAFSVPELDRFLKKQKIKNLILTGVYSAYCVDTTLRSAFTKGYNIIVPKDLVAMPKEKAGLHRSVIKIWKSFFAHVVDLDEIIDAIGKL